MSDKPTINVTRGQRSRSRQSAAEEAKSPSSDSVLPQPIDVVTGVMRGARNAWLAGLGVLSVAEDASARAFDALVERGSAWQETRREQAEASDDTQALTLRPTRTLEGLEDRVRREVNAALVQVGVPRQGDIDDLRAKIDRLSETVDRLADAVEERRAQ